MTDIGPVSLPQGVIGGEFDSASAEAAVRQLLIAIGENPDRDGLRDTPARVARAYAEMFGGLRQTPDEVLTTTFDAGHDEMVIVKDIELYSTCEHHLVPFHGVAHIGYIPNENGRITGLSKLARLVEVFAKRPQVQERLTEQIAAELKKVLKTEDVAVYLDAEHLCVRMRGVEDAQSSTVTSHFSGRFREPAARAEFIQAIKT